VREIDENPNATKNPDKRKREKEQTKDDNGGDVLEEPMT